MMVQTLTSWTKQFRRVAGVQGFREEAISAILLVLGIFASFPESSLSTPKTMVLSEVFIAASLQALIQLLSSAGLLKLVFGDGLRKKLYKWKDRLIVIQEVLGHADEKQRTDEAVKRWLDDLRDLTYDVIDILDEFATEALRAENQASTSKFILACCTPLVNTNIKLWLKVRKITAQFNEIMRRKDELALIENVEIMITWTSTSLLVDKVYGRDEAKGAILELLLRERYNNDANICVIPIDGMGGIGKTTLVQFVFNDEEVQNHFDVKVWAHVSDNFNVLELTQKIFTCVICQSWEDERKEVWKFIHDSNDLNLMQIELRNLCGEKSFLVILDDLWTFERLQWNVLLAPFLERNPKNRIIITTRDQGVSSQVGTVPAYHLQMLSDDACLSVFNLHAMRERAFSAADPNLANIGGRICLEKCKGLPLAAVSYGGILHSIEIPDPCKWAEVSNRRILDAPPEREEIFSDLIRSYDVLPSHLKRCFEHCSIIPEGYEFDEGWLVRIWMAESLIQPEKEDLGREYFQLLVKKSFFQKSSNDESKFMMHDLINWLARWVGRGTYFRMDDISKEDLKKARHLSYLCDHSSCPHNFEAWSELTARLRTFLPLVPPNHGGCRCNCNFPLPLLLKCQHLRVLSLSGYHITELPKLIGNLQHLRYLDLSNTSIKSLPQSITTLYNLRTLLLENCPNLRKFPSKFAKLVNLRYLDIRRTSLPEEIPRQMDALTCLLT